jgi:hypothetical protein
MTPVCRIGILVAVLVLAACNDATSPNPNPNPDLTAPQQVQAVATSAGSVRVLFLPVQGATSYVIERAAGTSAFAEVGTSTSFFYDDLGLQAGTEYRYRVTAARGSQRGPQSALDRKSVV